MEWMKRYYEGHTSSFPVCEGLNEQVRAVGHAFELLKALIRAGGNWATIEPALPIIKAALESKTGNWRFA